MFPDLATFVRKIKWPISKVLEEFCILMEIMNQPIFSTIFNFFFLIFRPLVMPCAPQDLVNPLLD